MKDGSIRARLFRRAKGTQVFWEAIGVVIAGVALGYLANYCSPKGLGLAHDYFPGRTSSSGLIAESNAPGQSASNKPAAGTNTPSETTAILRLKQNGLQMVDAAEMWRLFNDPRYQQRQIVFIDARDDQHYAAGHIPGAIQFDHYHPEKYLMTVFTACQPAEQVVVYCNGGNCEDSEYSAIMLKDAGIAAHKLFVYLGGITEWTDKKYPTETGGEGGAEQPAGTGK